MIREEAINAFKEWIERDKKIEYADRLENIEIYKLAIKALEQRWIPVTEKLPEEVKTKGYGLCNVLVTHKYAGIFRTCFAVFDKGKFYTNDNFKREDTSVIAWMSLPEPYQAESEDKDE